MKEDQIREVMWLVRQYGDKNYLQGGADAQDRELSSKKLDDEIRGKVLAIDTKLRELLPVWQPIESVPKEGVFLVLGGQWYGEISDPSPSDIAIVSYDGGQFSEVGGDYYSSWINNPTHWMPLPKAPG